MGMNGKLISIIVIISECIVHLVWRMNECRHGTGEKSSGRRQRTTEWHAKFHSQYFIKYASRYMCNCKFEYHFGVLLLLMLLHNSTLTYSFFFFFSNSIHLVKLKSKLFAYEMNMVLHPIDVHLLQTVIHCRLLF